MHAGPPTALLGHACAEALAGTGLALGRIGVDILAPVRVGEVSISTQVLRPGSRVALVGAELAVDGRPAMLARAWFLRRGPALPVPATPGIPAPPCEGEPKPVPSGWLRGYLDAVEWRWVSGGFQTPGPASVWARPLVDLIAGEPASPTERLLMVADSASGISAVASPEELLFVNVDLTVHLRREPRGDRFWMSAETRLDPGGSGVTTGSIGDADGDLASTAQLLFVQPRPSPPVDAPIQAR